MLCILGIKEDLATNEELFNYINVYNQRFDILPAEKDHYGAFIEYQDIKELREDFLYALIDTIVDWVYSQEKYKNLMAYEIAKGNTESVAASTIIRAAKLKFRGHKSDKLLSQGQFGELLLFHFIQRCFHAAPLLRKMPITTSAHQERFGADAIHYKNEDDANIIFLGEAKTYTKGSFNKAFETALDSIMETYANHRNELNLYIHEDFLDKKLNDIAEKYLNNTLKNVEVRLVCIIAYNETKKIEADSEVEIRESIKNIIKERYSGFDKSKIKIDENKILKRITYIVFPIWKLEELVNMFQDNL